MKTDTVNNVKFTFLIITKDNNPTWIDAGRFNSVQYFLRLDLVLPGLNLEL